MQMGHPSLMWGDIVLIKTSALHGFLEFKPQTGELHRLEPLYANPGEGLKDLDFFPTYYY